MIDFKTAKEIVLALKKIAANISGDKSNSNTNTNINTDTNTNTNENNNDDNLNYVIFNYFSNEPDAFESNIIFKLYSDVDKDNVFDKTEATLGELFASDTLIKLFNKAIEIIREAIDEKGYTGATVDMVYSIEKEYNNDDNYYDYSAGNLIKARDRKIISSDLIVRNDNGKYVIEFYEVGRTYNVVGNAETTTIFDENTPINWNTIEA